MLIGRCMNPEEHDMKALITNIPTIWKLEGRVAGTDLGLGKFQFAFEREEFRMAPTYESIGDAILEERWRLMWNTLVSKWW
uniref:DUF4283 domain-containing protein n=1 Tax=Brassica oleracea var. oleracea TaxID=109376 RepID=A0A0D3D2N9_BRAOL